MYINSYCFADFLVFPSYLLIICPGVAWLFPVTSSVCLSLSSDLSIPSSLLCRAGLEVVNSFTLFIS